MIQGGQLHALILSDPVYGVRRFFGKLHLMKKKNKRGKTLILSKIANNFFLNYNMVSPLSCIKHTTFEEKIFFLFFEPNRPHTKPPLLDRGGSPPLRRGTYTLQSGPQRVREK